MERLTRKETVVVRGEETAACNYENDDCNDQCRYETCKWQEKANMLLKRYEDTGLTPDQIHELKERDTAKAPKEVSEEYGYFECPSCGKAIYASDNFESHKFCLNCGQRVKWED